MIHWIYGHYGNGRSMKIKSRVKAMLKIFKKYRKRQYILNWQDDYYGDFFLDIEGHWPKNVAELVEWLEDAFDDSD